MIDTIKTRQQVKRRSRTSTAGEQEPSGPPLINGSEGAASAFRTTTVLSGTKWGERTPVGQRAESSSIGDRELAPQRIVRRPGLREAEDPDQATDDGLRKHATVSNRHAAADAHAKSAIDRLRSLRLFDGLLPAILVATPASAVFFGAFDLLQPLLAKGVPSTTAVYFLASGLASLPSVLVKTPAEVVKQRLQVGQGGANSIEAARALIQNVSSGISEGRTRDQCVKRHCLSPSFRVV